MGIPLYGRAFENTNGIGSSYNGVSGLMLSSARAYAHSTADWSRYDRGRCILIQSASTCRCSGTADVHFPPLGRLTVPQVYENLTDVTSYSYDSSKRELVTYETPNIASIKAQYVRDKGLAGSMFWEVRVSMIAPCIVDDLTIVLRR